MRVLCSLANDRKNVSGNHKKLGLQKDTLEKLQVSPLAWRLHSVLARAARASTATLMWLCLVVSQENITLREAQAWSFFYNNLLFFLFFFFIAFYVLRSVTAA